MRKVWFAAAASIATMSAAPLSANAGVVVMVSKSQQTMYVYVDGVLQYEWPVSTARWGYSTPSGEYGVTGLDAWHRSARYGGSPMPYSIFFQGGYAIHGSYETGRIGEPASHGCIRLYPEDARELYGLVRQYGSEETRIIVGW
jgi:lipoprotein-anchoring transpeptidase ErfK/SrfK